MQIPRIQHQPDDQIPIEPDTASTTDGTTTTDDLSDNLALTDEETMRTWSDIRPPLDAAGRVQGLLAGEGSQGTSAATFEVSQSDEVMHGGQSFQRYIARSIDEI